MNCEKCGTVMVGKTELHCPSCNFKSISGVSYESLEVENTHLRQRVEDLEKQVDECGRKFLQENATNVQQLNQRIKELEAKLAECENSYQLEREENNEYADRQRELEAEVAGMKEKIRNVPVAIWFGEYKDNQECLGCKALLISDDPTENQQHKHDCPVKALQEALSTSTGSNVMARLEAADNFKKGYENFCSKMTTAIHQRKLDLGVMNEITTEMCFAYEAYRACESEAKNG